MHLVGRGDHDVVDSNGGAALARRRAATEHENDHQIGHEPERAHEWQRVALHRALHREQRAQQI